MAVEMLRDASSTFWAVERMHYRNSGVISMPVYGVPLPNRPDRVNGGANANQLVSARIIRLHAPIEAHMIKWACVKEGAAPLVPNPYLFDTNMTFKSGQRSGAIPVTLPGYKGHAWSMAGMYEYLMTVPVDLNSDMPLGLEPWDTSLAIGDSKFPAANFVSYLLEALQRQGSSPGA